MILIKNTLYFIVSNYMRVQQINRWFSPKIAIARFALTLFSTEKLQHCMCSVLI